MILSMLATYLLHSTVLLSLALLASLAIRRTAAREILLRGAIFGAVATSAMAHAGIRSHATVLLSEAPATVERKEVHETFVLANGGSNVNLRLAPDIVSNEPAREPNWSLALLAIWFAGAIVLLFRLAWQHARLRTQLHRRHLVTDPAAIAVAEQASRDCAMSSTPRLTTSTRLNVPVAIGFSEVCLPRHSVTPVDATLLRIVLAHEITHLRRHDPQWFLATDIVTAVFWFHPLNWFIRRRIHEYAEFHCDDVVVRSTGSRLLFAEMLVRLAEELKAGHGGVSSAATGLGDSSSPFVRRIARILHHDEARLGGRERVLLFGAAATALTTTLFCFPGGPNPTARLTVDEEMNIVRHRDGSLDTTRHEVRRRTP